MMIEPVTLVRVPAVLDRPSIIFFVFKDLKTLEFRLRSLKMTEMSLKISASESKSKFSFVFSIESAGF